MLLPAVTIAADDPDSTELPDPRAIEWHNAFVVGTVSRATPADTKPLDARLDRPVELHLILEGVEGGLPVYCSPVPRFRIDGRMIPERLILDPRDSGLSDVEIHWVELRPLDVLGTWRRTRLPAGDMRWSLLHEEFAGEPAAGMSPKWGTGRFAAGIAATDANGVRFHLGTSGWTKSPKWRNPETPPGYRVTSSQGLRLADRVVGLARLPVDPGASETHRRQRIVLHPADLVLAAYEDLTGARLPTGSGVDLEGQAWSWLFTPVHHDLLRLRTEEVAVPLMAPGGRGIPWTRALAMETRAVERGDVLLIGDTIALLDRDDGDNWLSERDFVFHTLHGEVARGRVADLPGRKLDVIRVRSFSKLKQQLEEAGYGRLDRTALFDTRVRKACREFQRDRGLDETGLPDQATRALLLDFLEGLRNPVTPGEGGTTP